MLEIKAWSMPPHPPPPQAECLSFEWDEKQAYMHQCQHDPRTNTPTAMENLYLWQNSVSIWKTCIWQNSAEITPVVLIDRKLRNRKKKQHVDTVQMRENGSSLNFNFISIPNPAVDENWVCWHRLQQLIFGRWCCVHCFDLFKLFSESHIYWTFPLCVCVQG